MLNVLEIVAGVVLGLGTVCAVFWFTFRSPPPINRDAADRLNSEGMFDQSGLNGGSDGHHGV